MVLEDKTYLAELEDAWETHLRTISALRYKFKHVDNLIYSGFDNLYRANKRMMENDFDLYSIEQITSRTKDLRYTYFLDK